MSAPVCVENITGADPDASGLAMAATIPALPPDLPALQKIAAQCRISLQLLLWPILGIVHTNARVVTRRSIFSLRGCRRCSARIKALAEEATAAVETVGHCLLALIARHAAAVPPFLLSRRRAAGYAVQSPPVSR